MFAKKYVYFSRFLEIIIFSIISLLLSVFIGYFVALARRLRTKTDPEIRIYTLPIVDELWYADSFRIQNHNGF